MTRGQHPALEAELNRVINTIPKFKLPAIQNGKPVSVRCSLPIVFVVYEPTRNYHSYNQNNSFNNSNSSRNNF
jgi:hypothetical protein